VILAERIAGRFAERLRGAVTEIAAVGFFIAEATADGETDFLVIRVAWTVVSRAIEKRVLAAPAAAGIHGAVETVVAIGIRGAGARSTRSSTVHLCLSLILNAIRARRLDDAAVGTCIGINAIPVIALLRLAFVTIAAGFARARRGAAVAACRIPVIALLAAIHRPVAAVISGAISSDTRTRRGAGLVRSAGAIRCARAAVFAARRLACSIAARRDVRARGSAPGISNGRSARAALRDATLEVLNRVTGTANRTCSSPMITLLRGHDLKIPADLLERAPDRAAPLAGYREIVTAIRKAPRSPLTRRLRIKGTQIKSGRRSLEMRLRHEGNASLPQHPSADRSRGNDAEEEDRNGGS
jgi:hypothetical protein